VFLKDLEAIRPSAIIDIIHSGETFQLDEDVKSGMKALRKYRESLPDVIFSENCLRCGYISSNDLCVSTQHASELLMSGLSDLA
jgi:cytoplasmic tRNA 2-thiolation protein 1